MNSVFILSRMPMPPSSNNTYPTIMRKGRMFRVKSGLLKTYEKEMQAWRLSHLAFVSSAYAHLKESLSINDSVIRVDRYFFFPKSKLIGQKGQVKKIDVTNRVKALDDSLADHVLGIDDKYFWAGECEKLISESDETYVTVVLTAQSKRFTIDFETEKRTWIHETRS